MLGIENRDWLVRLLWQNLAEPSGAGRTWRNPQAQSRELSELRRTIEFHLYIEEENTKTEPTRTYTTPVVQTLISGSTDQQSINKEK